MLEKYRAAFAALTPSASAYLWERTSARHPDRLQPPNGSGAGGEQLFDACSRSGIYQAEVVMSVVADPSPEATTALEALIGRKLRRPPPEPPGPQEKLAAATKRRAAARGSDPRPVLEVAPNPRKEGTAAHAGYACWRVGDTVDACIARGLPPRYVRKDTERGRVRLGPVPR